MKYFSSRVSGKLAKLCVAIVLVFTISSLDSPVFSQLSTTCDNSNFNLGNFKGWNGCYGHYYTPCTINGFLLAPNPPNFNRPLHKLISAPGWLDHQTCDNLLNVFPGESFVARIGDTAYSNATGKEAEMSYQVTVSNDSYLFIYRYAVVLQTGGHAPPQHQPDFQIMITDAGGNVLDSTCGYYYITAQVSGPPVAGWNLCTTVPNGNTYWKDWTTVGMDLTAYFGQTIYVTFKVRPCQYDTHFGYAYISAYCGYLQLQTAMCEGDTSATLTAPPGFLYLWSTGDTTQSIVVPNPVTGASYNCTLTAVNGCTVTITVNLTYTVIHSNFNFGSACAGSPTQFNDSSWVNQNAVTDWKWDFGDGTPLVLGVANPTHTFALPGTYDVKMVSYSTEGCADSIVKQIHVDTVATLTNTPLGDTLCSLQSTNFTMTGSLPGTTFTWTATCKIPEITGYSNNNVPTNLLDQTLINTSSAPDTVFYTIYPHTGNCIGPDTTYWVIVSPLPDLTNNPLDTSICNNTTTNIALTASNPGTQFTWTCTASSGNLSGYSNNTTTPGNLISQVIVNSGYGIDTVYYHLVPQLLGCPGDTMIFKVAVYPTANVSNSPLTKTICDNAGTNITLTSSVAGAQFTWTCIPSGPNVTGWSNNAIPTTILNQNLDVTGNNVQTVTYHITPQIGGCPGNPEDYIVTVNPTPTLTNSPATHNQCNSTNTLLRLIPNIAGTLFTWTCTPSAPSITGYAANAIPDDSINQVLTNTSYIQQSVTYSVTPEYSGCTGPASDYVVKVYPTPDLSNNPPSKSQCSNLPTNIALTSNVTGTLFTWTCTPSSGNITGWSDNATPTALLNHTLVNTGVNTEWVTYTLTPSAYGCFGPDTNYVVTVFPTPAVTNSPQSQPQCNGQNTNITLTSNVAGTLFTWTCTPSSGSITGWANNAVPAGSINQVLDNTGSNTETVIYTITPTAGGCNGTPVPYTVTVFPTPTLSNSPLTKGICMGQSTNINLTSNVAGTLFTWTCTQTSGNISGYSANPGPPSALINQVLTLTGVVKDSVIYHITPRANGCFGPVTDFKVIVNPVPSIITNPLFDSICSGTSTNVHLIATCAGTTFNWTAAPGIGNVSGFANGSGDWIIQTLTNNLNTVGSVVYTITPSTSTCLGLPETYTMYVKPTPDVTNTPPNTAICNNMPFLLNLTSGVAGTTFTWTCTPSSPNITGWANNAIPATTINQTLVNSSTGPETVTYNIIPTALGCNGPPMNYDVTVYLTALVTNAPPLKDQCDSVATNVTLTSNVPGATFTWTCTPSSGNVTGWANNAVPTTLLDQTLDNTGFNIEWVTYEVTPTANGCSGAPSNFTVTVYPKPDLTNSPLTKTQCDSLNTNIPLTSNVAGTQFTWTCTPSSANISGWSNNAVPAGAINHVLDNTGVNIEWVTYHITPTANGCTGITYDYVVTVNPTPQLTNDPASQAQCNNFNTNITLTSGVAGTLFTWTCTPSSGNITGWANSVAPGTTINQLLTNSGLGIETVTYHVTPEANLCIGPMKDYVVSVVLTTDLSNNPPLHSQCNNSNTNLTLTSSVIGTTFTWTCSPSSGNVTGWANNAIPTTVLNQTLVNSGVDIETVTYNILPSVSGCPGTLTPYVVTVFPEPDLSNSPATKIQCDDQATNVTLTSNVAGTEFTWTCTPSSGNITGWSDNGTPTTLLDQTLDNTGFDIETVTYEVTPVANGCNGPPAFFVVTVNPTPNLSNNPDSSSQCNNSPTNISLTSNVAGTQFTWTCNPSSGNITGWSANATPTTTINQTLVNAGYNIEWVTYQVTPAANGCIGTMTPYVVTVFPTPDLSNLPASKSQCDSTATNVTLTSNIAGTTFTWTCTPSSGNITGWANNAVPTTLLDQTLDNTGYNIESVTYQVTPTANGCAGGPAAYTVTVFPTPNLSNFPASQGQCNNTFTNITLASNVAGTQFTWTCTPSSAAVTGWSNNAVPSNSINHQLFSSSNITETVTYHVTPIANLCSGPVTDYVVTINPTATVTNNPAAQEQCDSINTNILLTSNVAGTLFTWTCTTSSANITGWANNGVPAGTISQVLNNTGNNIEWVTYQITPTAYGCPGTMSDYTVTVNPTPELSNSPPSKSQCNNMPTNVLLTSNVAGTQFTWTCIPSSGNITGWSDNAAPTTLLNQTLDNAGFNIEWVTYQVTPTANGCIGPMATYVVTVFPTPDLSNTPATQTQCDDMPTNITLTSNVAGTQFTWTCAPSSANITGWASNAVLTTTLNQTLNNTGFNIEWVTYHVTPTANGCAGPVMPFVVTVNPTPDLSNTPNSKSQCDSTATNITLTSNIAGTTFTWTCTPSSGNVTGWANNAVPTTLLDQTLDNTGYNIESVTYQVTPTANGCSASAVAYVVTVFPTPNLSNFPASHGQCNNTFTNIALASNVAGTQFTWTCTPSSAAVTGWSNNAVPSNSINHQLISSSNITETVTYHLTPIANLCTGPVTDYVVTIYPTAAVTNNPPLQNQCDSMNTNILLTSNVAGTLFTWTCAPSSANITGWSNNAIPAPSINQLLINLSTINQTVTYTIMPTAFGCSGTSSSFTVTVYPTPTLSNLPPLKSQCNLQSTNITLTSNVAGTQFTWTCVPSSGNITGWSDNATLTTLLDQTLDNTGFNVEWVTYNVTPTANGCPGPMTPYVVTVFPTADLSNFPASMQLCNNSATNLTLTSNVAGTSFTWTCAPSSANITGWANNAVPTTVLNQFLTNLGLNTEWVTYTITPSANGCPGNIADYTVTVVQSPDVFFNPPAQTICSQQTSNIQVLSSVPGTTFTWTVTASSPNLSGHAPGSGNTIAQTITNSGNTIEGVTYIVTPTAFGCPPGLSQNVILTVNPTPAVNNANTTSQICSAASTSIFPTSTVPGSTYTWTASGSSANVSGYSNGAGMAIIQALTNTGFNIESATYQVAATANGCTGNATPFTVTVFPVADVVFTPNGQSFCSGLTSSISISSNVAGTSFTWTATGSGPSLSGYFPGSGNFIQQTLFNSGPYPETATFQVAPTANGCPGTSNSAVVTVNPFPGVTFTPCFDPVVSVNAQPIVLKGALPYGGNYSGTGVSAGVFNPAFAGPGNHVITYDYSNTWGCPGSANAPITVVSLAPFTCGNSVTDVRDNQAYPTVQIGGQCWFVTNLNYGATIPSAQMQRDNCTAEKYCYGDNPANCATIGGMYQWDELMQYRTNDGAQGFCPPEWHVPSETDWATLFNFYISNGFAGSSLKYTGYSGFNAFLDGTRFNNVQWDFSSFAVMFWSSTQHFSRKAWAHGMNTFNPSVSYYPSHRNNAFWVRCIKD